MYLIDQMWKRYTTPPPAAPEVMRKEFAVRAVQFFATILVVPVTILILIAYKFALVPLLMATVAPLSVLVLLGGWWLIERGHWQFASYMLIFLTLIIGILLLYNYGFTPFGALFFVAAIMFAAITSFPLAIWLLSGASFIILISFAYAQKTGKLQPLNPLQGDGFIASVITLLMLFAGLGALMHFLTSQYSKALVQAEATTRALRTQQETLETLVAERTAQLQSEVAQHEETTTQLELALEAGQIAVWDWDLPSGLISANPRWSQMLGYEPDEVEATPSGRLLLTHPDDLVPLWEAFQEHREGNTPVYVAEQRMRHKSGRWMWIQTQGKIAGYDENGAPTRIIGVALDIDDRKRAEETTEKSLAEKTTLLKEIHHRVKNNLQIIRSLLFLQSRYTSQPDAQVALQESMDRVHAMATVHELLYRSDNLNAIELSEYIHNLTDHIWQSYPRPNVVCRLDIAPLTITAEKAISSGLIATELISNALKHAFPEQKGNVTISVGKDGETICYTVADDGIGFPEDLRQVISENGLATASKNSLGLNLINQLTRQLHGDIVFDWQNGTRATLTFKA